MLICINSYYDIMKRVNEKYKDHSISTVRYKIPQLFLKDGGIIGLVLY